MKKTIFLMVLLMSATWTFAQTAEDDGNDSENVAYLLGAVTDQDGTPVVGAKVTLDDYMGNLFEDTTDSEGKYEIRVQAEDKDYYPTVTAAHYAPFVSEVPIIANQITGDWNIVLYNAIEYKKNVRSTIILPVDPEPSAGIYYKLDHCTDTTIVFEREWSPKAGVPYVFTPNADLLIDLREMTLTKGLMVHNCDGAYAWASYGEYLIINMAMNNVPVFYDGNQYDIKPLHVVFGYRYNRFRPDQEPEIIFKEVPYRPFIEKGKVWKVGYMPVEDVNGIPLDPYVTCVNLYYYFNGDTIIDGRKCKKMMCQNEPREEYTDWVSEGVQYIGAYYEQDRQVFFIKERGNTLEMLYDFALNVGDSLDRWAPLCASVVKEKRMGGMDYFKGRNWIITVSFVDWNEEIDNVWMEGVGSMYTPDFDLMTPDWGTIPRRLMSCTVGDEVIYYNPDIIDGVNPPDEETKKRIDFTHVPKPRPKAPQNEAEADGDQLSGEYTLRLLDLNLGNMSDTYDVTITDDAGEVVYQKTVRTADVLALNIDISEWAAPSYTINVENDYEQYIGTFELTPTSIEEKYQEQSTKNNDVYDLQGRRVTSPTKGLYIKNGHKYLKR